ncbi:MULTISPECIES: DegV family protein [Cytobacillus]|jgi:DegV family protein with EDD domain|uniref:Fatty acid-binding protein DegV n=1 Tax=Cytobacillus oceanisediminis 2691 TaxID=1196031 RepID=A0A160MDL1_9BACI|nr:MULTISPECIES: DegV family protein [Cytobacillus]EFV77704.1 DegV family protein [Bacillus sp. 2_A_57_CT2]MBY0154911.1 DegV family protein [Cytobacillus firmus]AND41112.1 fatty acid-binding protein DegV [Cytobacillus oceanisediminis 2691]MBU8731566.1 DegV family protein [Cytobacillus oceanisediminis]MBU8771230.1 DegV family protein [Cytobacillus oceanisediminis]
MAKIKIVTDSTADLSSELIEKFDIEVVPLSIHIEGNTYLDRVDITPSEFMRKMKEADELPKSSQPPAGVLAEVYDRFGDQGYDILSIHMTGGMSGTVQSAESAAAMSHANVTVVDSRYISKALAFQVLEAAKMASEGKSIQEIVSRLETIRSNTKLFVVVDTLENLVKGGRIGKGKAMIGSLLNIKPIASLEGGVYTPVAKVRSHTQVAKYLAKQFAEDIKGKTIKGVGLVHAEGIELASKLKKMIEELDAAAEIEIEETTPIISTHTGPGAIGFMYHLED